MDTTTVTVPGSQSPTTHYDHDTFNSSPTHTGAKVTSESVTVLYPADIEQGIIIDTDPSLSTTARKSSQAVILREAVAWALLSLMTLLLFIGILSLVTILCMQKRRQRRDSTVTAKVAAYEMDGNPCYESSKMDTTYEPIETESLQYL